MNLKNIIQLLILLGLSIEMATCVGRRIPNMKHRRQISDMGQCQPGYYFSNGECYPSVICPEGYKLQNSLCYPLVLKPCPFESSSTTTSTTTTTTPLNLPIASEPIEPTCPEGYFFQDSMCHLISVQHYITTTTPKIAESSTTSPINGCAEESVFEGNKCCSPIAITKPKTTTTPPESQIRCPYGSVRINEKCQKIFCSFGEYQNGLCLQAICPRGMVWRGRSCRQRGVITAVIEIDNVFLSEAHNRPGEVNKVNINNITYYTDVIETTSTEPAIMPSATTENISSYMIPNNCCTILTPRQCKKYGRKWICFHNRLMRCYPNICKYPTIYLKTPKIIYEPPVLIIPPNPPLKACPVPNCDSKEIVDCSGCAQSRREGCSPYCYQYICPKGECGFINLDDYCVAHPGEVGCTKQDGCIWDWCNKSNSKLSLR